MDLKQKKIAVQKQSAHFSYGWWDFLPKATEKSQCRKNLCFLSNKIVLTLNTTIIARLDILADFVFVIAKIPKIPHLFCPFLHLVGRKRKKVNEPNEY